MSNQQTSRDYSAISPSAKSLLLLKGITNIPFARAAAEWISYPEKYQPDINNNDIAFWKRVVHFEGRYWSIDQLLSGLEITNILELSSGYSFRGLDTVRRSNSHYIDTDLPELINQKKEILAALEADGVQRIGKLETLPLNALDEKRFHEIVDSFAEGPIVIVNEGLLMYLNDAEKGQLAGMIYKVLKARGGFWITADIYVKAILEELKDKTNDNLKELVDQQHTEDNMFESFDIAEVFLKKYGLVIDKEAPVDLSKISSLKYLLSNVNAAQLAELQAHRKIQTSWRLKVKPH